MINFKIIAVDFDGTLCENEWPEIGKANMEVIKYLQKEKKNGAKVILWTCRTGKKLINAILWCSSMDLVFDAVNENVPEAILEFGSDTRKVFAHEYIDDKTCNMFKLPFKKEPTFININQIVKVKLNPLGVKIYYHQYDLIPTITPTLPHIDEQGYTKFQIWNLMQIYGKHIGVGEPLVFDDLNFILDEGDKK